MAQRGDAFVPRVSSAVRRHARRDLMAKRTRISTQTDSLKEQQVTYSYSYNSSS